MSVISQLAALKRRIGTPGGLDARVEFVSIAYHNGVVTDLCRYVYWDEFAVGERDFDTCFEMGDAKEVIHGVIERALSNSALLDMLKQQIGSDDLARWMALHQEVRNGQSLAFDF